MPNKFSQLFSKKGKEPATPSSKQNRGSIAVNTTIHTTITTTPKGKEKSSSRQPSLNDVAIPDPKLNIAIAGGSSSKTVVTPTRGGVTTSNMAGFSPLYPSPTHTTRTAYHTPATSPRSARQPPSPEEMALPFPIDGTTEKIFDALLPQTNSFQAKKLVRQLRSALVDTLPTIRAKVSEMLVGMGGSTNFVVDPATIPDFGPNGELRRTMEELWGAPETAALMKALMRAVIRDVVECQVLVRRLERRVKGLSPQKVLRPLASVPEYQGSSGESSEQVSPFRSGPNEKLDLRQMLEDDGLPFLGAPSVTDFIAPTPVGLFGGATDSGLEGNRHSPVRHWDSFHRSSSDRSIMSQSSSGPGGMDGNEDEDAPLLGAAAPIHGITNVASHSNASIASDMVDQIVNALTSRPRTPVGVSTISANMGISPIPRGASTAPLLSPASSRFSMRTSAGVVYTEEDLRQLLEPHHFVALQEILLPYHKHVLQYTTIISSAEDFLTSLKAHEITLLARADFIRSSIFTDEATTLFFARNDEIALLNNEIGKRNRAAELLSGTDRLNMLMEIEELKMSRNRLVHENEFRERCEKEALEELRMLTERVNAVKREIVEAVEGKMAYIEEREGWEAKIASKTEAFLRDVEKGGDGVGKEEIGGAVQGGVGGGRRRAVSDGAALVGERFKNFFSVGKVGRGKVRGLGEGEGDEEH